MSADLKIRHAYPFTVLTQNKSEELAWGGTAFKSQVKTGSTDSSVLALGKEDRDLLVHTVRLNLSDLHLNADIAYSLWKLTL